MSGGAYPTKATILVREGPRGTPWHPHGEYFDHGQEADPDVPELRSLRPRPVEEQIAEAVREIAKRHDWAILILWNSHEDAYKD